MVDWPIAAVFVLGGLLDGVAGVALAKSLAGKKRALSLTFAGFVIVLELCVTARGFMNLPSA
jgi:hypothetical protein